MISLEILRNNKMYYPWNNEVLQKILVTNFF